MLAKEEQPLRAELYNVEQLERHAKTLAASHRLATGSAPDKLITRLDENERILIDAYDLVSRAAKRKRRIAPAAEWLLDNFYLIEEQIRTARRHLPRSYSRELPRLATGSAATYPRVYGIALELISHVDGHVDTGSLAGFITAYQSITPLKLGELWAVPIMLRLALIENLRRVAARMASTRRDRDLAADWAEKMVQVVEQNPTDLILVMADMARANPPLTGAFLSEMTRHLQGQSPHFAFATSWLAQRLAEQGLTVEQLILADGQEQAADQVTMGHSITSLRFLTSNDWREFVEAHSVVERILREDLVYPMMDFTTRDGYRHAVEEIARRSPFSEQEVSAKAIELAEREAAVGREAEVGYYLIDEGRSALEASAAMRFSLGTMLSHIGRGYPLLVYLTGVLTIAAVIMAAFLVWPLAWDTSVFALCLIALPLLMCAAHLGVGLMNWLATLVVNPRPLPRMDFKAGIPPEHRTMVVVPTLLTSAEAVADLLEGLEVRYLANRDDRLHFALLTDFTDAPREVMDADKELVRLAREGIEKLNEKYAHYRTDIFYLFHRPRRWNAQEKVWMGYERKRGKLTEFNAFLRGAKEGFSDIVGDTAILKDVRYVITLDTDTQLPRDSARAMVGAMAHPLNRPVLDAERRRVVAGYGILQPRVGVSLPSAHRSWFVRLFAGDAGMDPYTRVVSDLYQDLFGEGSFIGKGIYDVDAFQQCCGGFPENAILSHDLLESTHVRSGLLSDVELYEEFPSRYPTDVSRRHRWMRGDWQIAGWLLPWVPSSTGEERVARDEEEENTLPSSAPLAPGSSPLVENPINLLSWWKIFDNLRRSLVPVALLLLLACSWLMLDPMPAMSFTLLVLAVIGAVPLLAGLADIVRKPSDLHLLTHLNASMKTLSKHAAQFVCTFIFLPHEAYVSVDAIVRTLVRMLWTKTRMLEWKTSSEADRAACTTLVGFLSSMWFGPALSLAMILLLAVSNPAVLSLAGPLLGVWFISPGVAWWLSRTLDAAPVQLSEERRMFLRKLARQTWRYFEVFVTAEDHWLPPDNFQEKPVHGVASRTSPTNIGMALLADLAACDFGYCSAGQLLDRIRKTFGTLGRMERYRGHFYNWYDTHSLKPLPPLYVSTVDSGNLAGHLLVLRSGLLELIEAKVCPPSKFAGLRDTLGVLLDSARELHGAAEAARKIERLASDLDRTPEPIGAATALLQRLGADAAAITASAGPDPEMRWWAAAFERSCADHRDDLMHIAAWSVLPAPPLEIQHDARELLARLDAVSLREVAELQQSMLPLIDAMLGKDKDPASLAWLTQLRRAIALSSQHASDRIKTVEQAARQCQEFADMDFTFLFDKARDLFAIGYNVERPAPATTASMICWHRKRAWPATS